MSKKIFTLVMTLFTVGYLCAQEVQTEVKGAHPYKPADEVAEKISHWSMIIEGGINFFDGDFRSEMKNPLGYPTAGLALEYSFTPCWAIGIGYTFSMPRVKGNNNNQDADILLRGMMHRPQAYISFDLINAFFPRAKKKIFSAQVLAGGGCGFYNQDIYYPDYTRHRTASSPSESMDKYEARGFIMGGLNLEFNLNRTLALGVKGTYSYFMKDDIDMRGMTDVASKNNDGLFDVTLNMRFKFAAVKKTHVRNVSNLGFLDKAVSDGSNRQAKKDTIVVYHRDTVVLIHNNTIREEITNTQVALNQADYYYIYFDPDMATIDNQGLTIIQQVADRMHREEDLYAEITGYCDNTGSSEYNLDLGQRRAQNVTDELVQEYGIDPSRILYIGKGILRGKRHLGAYAPNRRAEIHMCNKNEFEELKKTHKAAIEDAKKAAQPTTHEERVNSELTPDDNSLAIVVTQKGMTLSKLARKYYNNTFSWVYIYMANVETLKNPNYMREGLRLRIPALTEEQRTISKEEGQRLLHEFMGTDDKE